MRRWTGFAGLLLLPSMFSALLFAASATAQERILSYDNRIDIGADGTLDVTERIRVRAEGSQIRRGIYRDYPTRYRDRRGNRVVVGFEVVDVQRDGKTEPWFTENVDNGVRVNTGNDEFLPVPAEYTYTLRYRTTRQIGFFADHDELYWNAIGTGWAFPIEQGSVEARLPTAVAVESLQAEGYTGAQGEKGNAYVAELPGPGVARWRLTEALPPGHGLTVVLSFPKGVVAEPSRTQRNLWLLKDNLALPIAPIGVLALLWYCIGRWRRMGRDPEPGVIIARYDPPHGQSPAALRYLKRMGYDARCFSSDLLAMAVDGYVDIHRDKGFLTDSWRLEKTAPANANASEAISSPDTLSTLLRGLFTGGKTEIELEKSNATTIAAAQSAHSAALKKRAEPALFKRNLGSVGIAAAIGAGFELLAFVAAAATGSALGIAIAFICAVLTTVVLVVFAIIMKAPTPAGRKLLDEIEGLKLYLGVAERDELASMPGPEAAPVLDAKRYERLLPYAVALDVEEAWTHKFTLAVGAATAAATTAAIAWYHGGGSGDLGGLTHALGSSLSSQIASSSSPPGSSSGGGGGGSSGGGGGGGGGGGR